MTKKNQAEDDTATARIEKKIKPKSGRKTSSSSKLKSENTELKQQLDEAKDKFLRLFAEFDNYKKRTIREKMELLKLAGQETISRILPILDDFDRAKQSHDNKNSGEQFSDGVLLVYTKLYSVLKSLGLENMETEGKDFDPEFHEAITEIPAPAKNMKGKILDTVEKGYFLNDKIIRHAKVVVAK